jgi:hypothetical protein
MPSDRPPLQERAMMRHVPVAVAFATASLALAPDLHAQAALNGDKPVLKVGDSWRWVRIDSRTKAQEADTLRTITAVSADRIEGTENQGKVVLAGDNSVIESPEWVRTGTPSFFEFPLALGKKWSFKYEQKGVTAAYSTRWQYDAEVVAVEKVKVPAGEFDAFKVTYRGFWSGAGGASGSSTVTNWYAPSARALVRGEFASGRNSFLTELVELKLQP